MTGRHILRENKNDQNIFLTSSVLHFAMRFISSHAPFCRSFRPMPRSFCPRRLDRAVPAMPFHLCRSACSISQASPACASNSLTRHASCAFGEPQIFQLPALAPARLHARFRSAACALCKAASDARAASIFAPRRPGAPGPLRIGAKFCYRILFQILHTFL